MPELSKILAHAALDGTHGGAPPPAPTCTFAEHHATVVDIVVHTRQHVLSVDHDRAALLWDARTGELLARYEVPPSAILRSAFATDAGVLAYVAYESDTLSVCAVNDHRVLAKVAAPGLNRITIAACAADLSRMVLAENGDLVTVPLTATGQQRRVEVETHEPDIASIRTTDGRTFFVHFSHIAMDIYPTEVRGLFDGATLAELSRDAPYQPLPSTSPFAGASVRAVGTVVRVQLADGHLLPDLVAHTRPVRLTTWVADDAALLTADEGGTIHRWDLHVETDVVPAQHARPVSMVRFTKDGVLSFTDQDAKIWRDGALIATVPMSAFRLPIVDEEADRLVDVAHDELHTFSLLDGARGSGQPVPPAELSFGSLLSARGRISVGLRHAYPLRIVSLRDQVERTLPTQLFEIMSSTVPPMVRSGHMLLSYYTQPTRLVRLETLALVAERTFHQHGTCWAALHPDGATLYTAGAADGQIAAWDFHTLSEKKRWTVFESDERFGVTAVLLPRREQILFASQGRIRRVALDAGMLARLLGRHADCMLEQEHVEALIADAAEERVVAFIRDAPPRVLEVDSMTWVEPRRGEIAAAGNRRQTESALKTAYGFETAYEYSNEWLIGWSRALSVTAVSLDNYPLRPSFFTREIGSTSSLKGAMVDDQRDELWLLTRTGALMRTSLTRETPLEMITTIAAATAMKWAGPSMLAVFDSSGSMHCLHTTGERVCTIDGFTESSAYSVALTASTAVCAVREGLRVAVMPGTSYVTLSDGRTALPDQLAIAAPYVASLHGNQVLRWDLRTNTCTGAWAAHTTLKSVAIRADGTVLTGDIAGTVTLLR